MKYVQLIQKLLTQFQPARSLKCLLKPSPVGMHKSGSIVASKYKYVVKEEEEGGVITGECCTCPQLSK